MSFSRGVGNEGGKTGSAALVSSTDGGEVVSRQVPRLEPGATVYVGRGYSESARIGVNAGRYNAIGCGRRLKVQGEGLAINVPQGQGGGGHLG